MAAGLVVWGATGQCIVLHEFAADLGYEIVAVFDNNPNVKAPIPGIPLLGGEAGFDAWCADHDPSALWGIAAVGGDRGADRCRLQALMESRGIRIATMVHPTSFVAKNASVGRGSQILAQSAVAARAILGSACIVNTAAAVDHECRLGDGVHVGPGVHLAGCVTVGERTFLGIGAVVLPRLRIGANCVVGAGSVVTHDIPDDVVAYGAPARVHTRSKT